VCDALSFHRVQLGETMSRSPWIDNARGVAIALVVIGHVVQFGAHEQFDIFTNPLFITIYAFHMPLFVLLSGYLAYSSFQRRSGLAIVKDRCRTILLPMVAWTIVGGLLWKTSTGVVNRDFSIVDTLGYVAEFLVRPDMTLWFLWFLILANVAMAAAVWLQKWLKWAAIPLSIVLIELLPFADHLSIYQLKWLYPFFVGGYYLHRYKSVLVRFERQALVASAILFIGLIWFWQRADSIYVSAPSVFNGDPLAVALAWAYRYLLATCASVAVIGVIRYLSRQVRYPALGAVGRATLGIYGAQTFLAMLIAVLPSPASSPVVYFGLYVPVVSAAILSASYMLTAFVLRPVPILRAMFLGERTPRPAEIPRSTAAETDTEVLPDHTR
jgi:fucose 4-O-acetylase-like acetyltransferase